MLNIIKEALREAGISTWRINETETHSAELFFIRHALDTRRIKDVKKYAVTVFNDFEKDGKKMRGSSRMTFVPSQPKDEILAGLKEAYFAASFVENPFYELPEKQLCDKAESNEVHTGISAEEAALKMADAAFKADCCEKAFLNNIEMFAVKTNVRIITSSGIDVSYDVYRLKGEFVAQCKQPEDVEIYHSFAYDKVDCKSFGEKVRAALEQAADRAIAKKELPTGEYDLILSDDKLEEILSYYTSRANVQMVFPGYSTWKTGDEIQSESGNGEKLNITLLADEPYSGEGIPMTDRELIKDGRLQTYYGSARLSGYLGIQPTGDYDVLRCDNGTVSFDEMKKTPYLYPVAFSDFQMDIMSGHFGGEIRLAYYFDGSRTHIVTGGSINGSITECDGDFVFSKERYNSQTYHGPFAVKLKKVKAAGSLEE